MSVTFPQMQSDPNLQRDAMTGVSTLQALNQARAQYLKNQAAQATLQYAGPQAQAQLGLTNANIGVANALAGQKGAESGLLGAQTKAANIQNQLAQNKVAIAQYLLSKAAGNQNNSGLASSALAPNSPGGAAAAGLGGGLPVQPGFNQNMASKFPGVPAGSSVGMPIPVNQASNLGAAISQPGIPAGPLSQSLAPNASSQTESLSPLERQAKNIEDAKNQANLWAMMGQQNYASQLVRSAVTGNPTQQKLAANLGDQLKNYQDAAVSAQKIQPLLGEYEAVLKQIPPAALIPGFRGMTKHVSDNIQTLQQLSTQIMPLVSHQLGVSARSMTNAEMGRLGMTSLDPTHQLYGSLVNGLQNLKALNQRSQDANSQANSWMENHADLNKFKPSFDNSASIVEPNAKVKVIAPDGKTTGMIPASRVNDYLSNGYKRG